MSVSRSSIPALIGTAVAVLASAPALAATQTFTVVQPSVAAPTGAVFQLPQFNPALGTLTQVDLTWETSLAVNGQITQNGTAGSGNLGGASLQFDFNAPGVVIASINNPAGFLFSWLADTASPITTTSNPAFVGNGQQVNSSSFGLYTGTGSFNVPWQITDLCRGCYTWVGSEGSTMRVDEVLGGYNFSVRYRYDSVPEPGTLALLGLGLAGLGFTRRRKA